jgi:hypothetical protein
MEDSKPPKETDSIELGLIQELIQDNIVIILHRNGMTVMMDEDKEERTKPQMEMFARLYVAAQPSFVLRFFLVFEIWMLRTWDTCVDFFESVFKR